MKKIFCLLVVFLLVVGCSSKNESSILKDFLLKLGIDAALMINYAKAGKVMGAAPKYCSFRKMTPIKQPSRIKYFFNNYCGFLP